MTTIAYRSGVLAADTLINSSGHRIGYTPKIGRAGRVLYASCGSTAWGWSFRSWVAGGCVGDCPTAPDENTGGTLFLPSGDVISFHIKGVERRTGLPFWAEGSGADYALGAMQAGASAEEAVRAAMVWDTRTGGEVTVLRLHPPARVIAWPAKPQLGDKCARAAHG